MIFVVKAASSILYRISSLLMSHNSWGFNFSFVDFHVLNGWSLTARNWWRLGVLAKCKIFSSFPCIFSSILQEHVDLSMNSLALNPSSTWWCEHSLWIYIWRNSALIMSTYWPRWTCGSSDSESGGQNLLWANLNCGSERRWGLMVVEGNGDRNSTFLKWM